MHLGRKKIEKQAKIRGKDKKLLPKGQIKYEYGQKKQEKVCPKGQNNMHLGRKKIEKQAKIRGKDKKLLPKGQIKYEYGQKKQEKVCPKEQIDMHLGRKKIEKQAKIRGKDKKLLPKGQIKHEHGQKKQEKVCPKDTLICIWAERDIDYRLEETIIKEIDRKIKEKELLLSKIEIFMNNVTEGGLKYQQKNEKTYYYHQKKNLKTGRWEKIYIKKEQMSFAKELAQKAYFASVRTELKKQINQLRDFAKKYNDEAIDEIYCKLPEERKALVEPVSMGVKEKIDEWNNEIYETYQGFSDNMIYETDQGEMVRSKSEVIIANVLYQHREDIEYKYERPLELKTKEGKSVTIHPDFTIINKKTGKIYYYEHAGRIDESRYAMDFVRKMNLYSNNNILQGMDLMVTYETNSMPLDINCVKRIVRSILDE